MGRTSCRIEGQLAVKIERDWGWCPTSNTLSVNAILHKISGPFFESCSEQGTGVGAQARVPTEAGHRSTCSGVCNASIRCVEQRTLCPNNPSVKNNCYRCALPYITPRGKGLLREEPVAPLAKSLNRIAPFASEKLLDGLQYFCNFRQNSSNSLKGLLLALGSLTKKEISLLSRTCVNPLSNAWTLK